MEFVKSEIAALAEAIADSDAAAFKQLADLESMMLGGGCGDISLG